jgi:hypothetical protein
MAFGASARAGLGRLMLKILAILFVAYRVVMFIAQVDAKIQRGRAERLRDEMRSLSVGRSTWGDLQGIRARWGKWGDYDGECTAAKCNYTVTLGSPWGISRADRVLMYVGHTHFAGASLHVEVKQGSVRLSSYSLHTFVPPGYGPRWEAEEVKKYQMVPYSTNEGGYVLIGRASQLGELDNFEQASLGHPQYALARPGGCMECLAIWTEFAPQISSEEKLRMTDFNFSCITRWTPCKDEPDIMPGVGEEYLSQTHR